MKKAVIVLQIFFALFLYAVPTLEILCNCFTEEVNQILVYVALACAGVAFLLGLVMAILSIFTPSENNNVKSTMIIKLCLIPWFIYNFIICVLVGFVFCYPLFVPMLIIYVPGAIIFTYFIMMETSISNLAYLIKTKQVVKYLLIFVFHFIFCLDVVGAGWLYLEEKNQKNSI